MIDEVCGQEFVEDGRPSVVETLLDQPSNDTRVLVREHRSLSSAHGTSGCATDHDRPG
jgi:hypothetical protein